MSFTANLVFEFESGGNKKYKVNSNFDFNKFMEEDIIGKKWIKLFHEEIINLDKVERVYLERED